MDSQVPAELQEVFGEEVLAHTIVLLTCGDYLLGLKAEVTVKMTHSSTFNNCEAPLDFIRYKSQIKNEQNSLKWD